MEQTNFGWLALQTKTRFSLSVVSLQKTQK